MIHTLKLMHFSQNVALFFYPSGVKPIDYVLCVTRHARSDKTDKIVTYWVYKKPKKCLSIYVVSLQKIILEEEAFHNVNLVFQLFENILSLWRDESHRGMVCFRIVLMYAAAHNGLHIFQNFSFDG